MKKIILTLIVLGVLGAGTYAYYKNKGTPEPTVTTLQISRGDIADTVQATGTLQAVKTVNVGTQVSGVVQNLYADFNHIVKAGQVIARLDPSIIQTQIEQREASVTRAQADLERLRVSLADSKRKLEQAKGLWEKELIPRDQLDTAELNVKTQESQIKSSEAGLVQAQADLNAQKVNLGHTVITAPIDGIVIQRSVDEGQTVASSMNAPTLYIIAADLTEMQVLASIDESEVGRMRPGQPVTFTVDAYPNDRFRGTVEQVRLQPTTVQNVVTYSTVIKAPNSEYKLKPGMTANVTIEIARKTNVLRAPAAALRYRPTNDVFAALKQEVPPELQRGMGGPGGRGDGGRGMGGSRGQSANGTSPAGPAANAPAPAAGASAAPQQQAQADGGRRAEQGSTGSPQGGSTGSPQGGGDRGGDRPAGARQGEGGGRGNFANMTPEERQRRMEERMKSMTPEERERWEARMREGGGRGGSNRGGANASDGGGRGMAPGNGRRPQATPSRATASGAMTIDALFAPLPSVESRGRLWLYENKQLRSVAVRTGISDGQWTEILEDGDGPALEPGTAVVTNVVTGLEPAPRPGQQNPGGNPLMGPQRGGGPGGGGRGR
jgi:HlyD family secretion protein